MTELQKNALIVQAPLAAAPHCGKDVAVGPARPDSPKNAAVSLQEIRAGRRIERQAVATRFRAAAKARKARRQPVIGVSEATLRGDENRDENQEEGKQKDRQRS